MKSKIKACLVQDSPVFFNKKATIEKMIRHIETAASSLVDLIVFPESYVPGYPRGFTFGADIGRRTDEGKELYRRYRDESIDLKGPELQLIEKACNAAGIYLVAGITESEGISGSLYCTTLYVSPSQGLMGIHRKIKPTAAERIVWAEGDGSTLSTFKTEIGIIGGLTCWENYMPAARMAMYKQGVQLYIAPTADARPAWVSSMQHIALEGRCYVLSCNQYVTKDNISDQFEDQLINFPDILCRGGSMIVSPNGEILAGPVYDRSELMIVEIDMDEISRSKLDFDPNGHYTRPDIFSFHVNGQPDPYIESGK
ncbi:MAG: carbon-nitrogen hydrolase family protein [Saprospiraceae bacterium]|nr:carbon-nitrogen hydrolase family protein [Saprospiraceae bacterium]